MSERTLQLVSRGNTPQCAVCKEAGGPLTTCSCGASYHPECARRCPTLGCTSSATVDATVAFYSGLTTPKTERVKCWNCGGTGQERISEMCRSYLDPCSRCAATGYIDRPIEKQAFVVPTSRGLEIAEKLSIGEQREKENQQRIADEMIAAERRRVDELRVLVERTRHDARDDRERMDLYFRAIVFMAALFLAGAFAGVINSALHILQPQ